MKNSSILLEKVTTVNSCLPIAFKASCGFASARAQSTVILLTHCCKIKKARFLVELTLAKVFPVWAIFVHLLDIYKLN